MSKKKPTYEELESKLRESEALLNSIKKGKVNVLPGEQESLVKQLKSATEEKKRLAAKNKLLLRQWISTLNAINSCVWILDKDQRVVQANNAIINGFGCNKKNIVGKHCYELVHDRTCPIPECPLLHSKQILKQKSIEIELNGIWVEIMVNPILDEKGQYNGAVHVITEITERKLAEEALRESETKYRDLVATLPCGIVQVAANGAVTLANQEAQHILGLSYDEIIQRYVQDWEGTTLYEDGTPCPVEDLPVSRCLRSGKAQLGTVIGVRQPNGRVTWAIYSAIPLFETNTQQVVSALVSIRDITEHKQVEEKLQKSEQRLHQTLEATTDGIWEWNFKVNTLSFSPRYYTMLGYTPDEFSATFESWQALIHPDDMAAALSVAEKFLATKPDTYENEFRMKNKNGQYRWIHAKARVVERANDGSAVIMIGNHEDITERKKAEEVLRESEEKLTRLVQNLNTGIVVHAPDTHILIANEQASALLGLSIDQMMGKTAIDPAWKFLRDDGSTLPFGEYPINCVVNTLTPMVDKIIGINRPKTNDLVWVQVAAYPEFDASGSLMQVVVTFFDITERKRTEKALLQSQQNQKILLDNIPTQIWYLTDETTYGTLNQAHADFNGVKIEDLAFKNLYDIFPKDIVEVCKQSNTEVFSTKKTVHTEEWVPHVSGEKRLISIVKSPKLRDDGTVEYVVCSAEDITERKRMEEALLLEKENFRYSIDDSPLGVRIATTEGETIYANKTLLNYYAYDTLEELQNTPLKDRYTHESYIQAEKRKHRRKTGDFSDTDYEVSIIGKNREIRHLHIIRKEVLWNGVRQFQVICEDITERKKAEEEIEKSRKSLEDLNKRLTEIREEERKYIARELHDRLGQSLTALKIDLNRIQDRVKANPEVRAELNDVIELTSDTIKDVQQISSELRPEILFDLGLVAAVEWYTQRLEERTGIKCDFQADDSGFDDPEKNLVIFRILQEAFTNVIRHSKASFVSVRLRQTAEGYVVSVEDNGTGIQKKKIGSKDSLGIIGMRERARQIGGRIDILSSKNRGTTLTLIIP